MRNALQNLESFLGPSYHGVLDRSAEPWAVAVLRGQQSVASVPLTPIEGGYLTQALNAPEQRRPLVYFRLALRQGPWATGER